MNWTDIELPHRMRGLPRDDIGRPVPWFVATIDGKPDFRVVDASKLKPAVQDRLCWVCGHPLGRYKAFVIGPMCAVNRVTAEPPSHLDCATYSVRTCPFLSTPRMRRRPAGIADIEGHVDPPGIHLDRNPGAGCVWVTHTYQPFKPPGGGLMIDLGEPSSVTWWAQSRPATRAEVLASIDSGMPSLLTVAEVDGPRAVQQVHDQYAAMLKLLPPVPVDRTPSGVVS